MKTITLILTLITSQFSLAVDLGTFDLSFNGKGWVQQGAGDPSYDARGSDIVVDSLGRILVTGVEEYQDGLLLKKRPRIIRYLPEGEMDLTFGNSGVVVLSADLSPAHSNNENVQLALGENNTLFVAYNYSDVSLNSGHDIYVKYIDNTGSIISSAQVNFELQGADISRKDDFIADLYFNHNIEKIIVVANVERIGDNDDDFGIASLSINPNTGELTNDLNFNSTGQNTCYFDLNNASGIDGRKDEPFAVTFDTNSQNYIVAGVATENNGTNNNGKNMAFCEFDVTGNLVSKWSTQQASPFVLDDIEVAYDIQAVDQNGTTILYVAGMAQDNGTSDFALVAYIRDFFTGQWILDTSFGKLGTGWVYTDFADLHFDSASNDTAQSLYVQKDGSIILAGNTFSVASHTTFKGSVTVAKYTKTGLIDTNWGKVHVASGLKDGKNLINTGTYTFNFDLVHAMTIEPKFGSILFTGVNAQLGFNQYKSILVKLHNDVIFANNFDF